MKRYALVIDDNHLVANTLVHMLDMLGYEAQAAFGPMAAVQALAQRVPNIVLLDIHMQGINGVEMCRYIRREPRLAQVPIVAISSDAQSSLVTSMREAGANDFLAKPIGFKALEEALRRVVKP